LLTARDGNRGEKARGLSPATVSRIEKGTPMGFLNVVHDPV